MCMYCTCTVDTEKEGPTMNKQPLPPLTLRA